VNDETGPELELISDYLAFLSAKKADANSFETILKRVSLFQSANIKGGQLAAPAQQNLPRTCPNVSYECFFTRLLTTIERCCVNAVIVRINVQSSTWAQNTDQMRPSKRTNLQIGIGTT
jgi:hypothetical protein